MFQMQYNYVVVAVLVSLIAGSVQKYHNCWIQRAEEAKQARLYLKSDVCKKSELRVKVTKYQDCAKAEYDLAINPSTRALYDVLEFYSICGSKQKRCEAVVSWVHQNKFFLMTALGLFMYAFYQWLNHEWQMQKINKMMQTHLLPLT